MTRKILCLVLAICMFGSVGVSAAESMQTGYWSIAYPYRYLTFATDGGSFIKTLELPNGEYVSLDEFIPTKDGYIFDGWYNDPRTKVDRVYAVTMNENITVYAKWIDDGTPKTIPEKPIGATNEEILAFGNHIDEKTGVPVTALWVQQNNKLKELMAEYNENFNK